MRTFRETSEHPSVRNEKKRQQVPKEMASRCGFWLIRCRRQRNAPVLHPGQGLRHPGRLGHPWRRGRGGLGGFLVMAHGLTHRTAQFREAETAQGRAGRRRRRRRRRGSSELRQNGNWKAVWIRNRDETQSRGDLWKRPPVGEGAEAGSGMRSYPGSHFRNLCKGQWSLFSHPELSSHGGAHLKNQAHNTTTVLVPPSPLNPPHHTGRCVQELRCALDVFAGDFHLAPGGRKRGDSTGSFPPPSHLASEKTAGG